MENIYVTAIELPPLPTNCYVIHNQSRALIVDPGGPPEAVIRYLDSHRLEPTHILLTHLHSDHTVGAGPLARRYAATIFASAKDAWMLDDYLGMGDDDWGIPAVERFSFNDLSAGSLPVLDDACTVLETPGHSPGGVSFYFKQIEAVFSGDTLFRRSAGRVDFAGGSEEAIMESLHKRLFQLPESTRVFPGHGRPFLLRESTLYQDSIVLSHKLMLNL